MTDGVFGIFARFSVLNKNFRRSSDLIRTYRNLFIDTDIHTLQFIFADNVFNHGVQLLLEKWKGKSLITQSFVEQWCLVGKKIQKMIFEE